jgi:hypothetical protein
MGLNTYGTYHLLPQKLRSDCCLDILSHILKFLLTDLATRIASVQDIEGAFCTLRNVNRATGLA